MVYFSASHPWLSAIDRPSIVTIPGLPVVLLAFFVAGLIVTVINPKHRWALSLSGRRAPAATTEGPRFTGCRNHRDRTASGPARAPELLRGQTTAGGPERGDRACDGSHGDRNRQRLWQENNSPLGALPARNSIPRPFTPRISGPGYEGVVASEVSLPPQEAAGYALK